MSWNIVNYFASKGAAREALLDEFEGKPGKYAYVPQSVRSLLIQQIEMLPDPSTRAVVYLKSHGRIDGVNGNIVTEVSLIYLG